MKRNRIITRIYKGIVIIGLGVILLGSCKSGDKPVYKDTLSTGVIHISADESFKPVIDSQIKVFESQKPGARIIVHYKPEAECLRDLNHDSTRMVIVTRGLNDEETKTLASKLSFTPVFGPIAYDAIAVVVNNQVRDSLFSMQDIRSLVKGTSGFKYKVLLDGTTATSTVRFVMDSLLKGQPMGKNVVAAENSESVIDYVSKNTDAIGLVGVSWIGNKDDSTQLSFLQKVKIAKVECKGCDGIYVDPVQYNIAAHRYPMVRPLVYILKENYQGLGSGFTNFLISEKGQKIFYRAYLLPAKMQFQVRKIDITE
jgi:phosphate transport system substrate-binding protein